MNEEWRSWRTGDYEVSNLGRVRRARPGRRTKVGQLLKPIQMKIGYLSVGPTIDGKNQNHYVHVMVAECFIGPRPDGYDVNHIDGNKANPELSNLEYGTHQGNMAHARASGLLRVGARHGGAKFSDDTIADLRRRRGAGECLTHVARDLGIAVSTASQIVNGHRRAS